MSGNHRHDYQPVPREVRLAPMIAYLENNPVTMKLIHEIKVAGSLPSAEVGKFGEDLLKLGILENRGDSQNPYLALTRLGKEAYDQAYKNRNTKK